MKKHIVITGKVQGIGFRYWLYKAAIQRNIDGWVRNKISGEVEALIIGNDENVNDLIKLCEKGPIFSKVTKVKVQNYQKEHFGKSFEKNTGELVQKNTMALDKEDAEKAKQALEAAGATVDLN